jgi:hypothetical protein
MTFQLMTWLRLFLFVASVVVVCCLLCSAMQGAEGAVADGHEPPTADALDR